MKTTAKNKLSKAQETALLKKYLKQRFGVVVKIRKEYFSGGDSLRVEYDLGCAPENIKPFLSRLQYGVFDGMTDYYDMKDSASVGVEIDGHDLEDFKYVIVDRKIQESVLYQVACALSKVVNSLDICKCTNKEEFYRNFETNFLGAWSWIGIARQAASKLNFCTQNADDIEIVEAYRADSIGGSCFLGGFHFIYEVAGKQYDTATFEEQKPELKKASRTEMNDVKIVDYSDKSIAVYGSTYEIKGDLRALGGCFNRNLKDGAGWIFPKSRTNEISDLIINYHQNTK